MANKTNLALVTYEPVRAFAAASVDYEDALLTRYLQQQGPDVEGEFLLIKSELIEPFL